MHFVRTALACAVLLLAATAAMAGDPIPGVDVNLGKNPGGNAITATTDADGRIVFKGLTPGDYELVIDGPSLVAAINKLIPPPAPEKKKSHSSFSIGIGGLFGGGSHHTSSGSQGTGPVQGGGSQGGGGSRGGSSSGGGMGLGLSIPLGGGDSKPGAGSAPMVTLTATVTQSGPGSGTPTGTVSFFSVETPYCPDSAKQGMRIYFTVPKPRPGAAISAADTGGIETVVVTAQF